MAGHVDVHLLARVGVAQLIARHALHVRGLVARVHRALQLLIRRLLRLHLRRDVVQLLALGDATSRYTHTAAITSRSAAAGVRKCRRLRFVPMRIIPLSTR